MQECNCTAPDTASLYRVQTRVTYEIVLIRLPFRPLPLCFHNPEGLCKTVAGRKTGQRVRETE